MTPTILFLAACLSCFQAPIAWSLDLNACVQDPKTIKTESGALFEEFKNRLKKDKVLLPNGEYLTKKILPSLTSMYRVDINNDGAEEYVLTWNEGPEGFLDLLVASGTAQGFKILAGPPTPYSASMGRWYGQAFIDPITKEEALLTRLCGKTYISFSGKRLAPSPSSWLWKNDKTIRACDPEWIAHSRSLFAKLYGKKKYLSAERLLESVMNQCGQHMDPELRLWIGNDLACAASHAGSETSCLKHIQAIKEDPAYAAAVDFLKETTELNASLCRGVNKTVEYDFDWLLNKNIANANDAIEDDRSDALLAAIVPETHQRENATLRENVGLNLSGPAQAKQLLDERFIVLAACRRYSCNDKGLLFIDVRAKLGLFAVNDWSQCASIGSRNIKSEQLPEGFRKPLKSWLKGLKPKAKCLEFIGPDGQSSPLNLRLYP